MATERTFVMLKPDCIKRGLAGAIMERIEKKGYRILDAKTVRLDSEYLYDFYAHISDQPYFLNVFNYMLSGVVLGLAISGDNAVSGVRTLVGATKIEDALAGTIRGDFASSTENNLIHVSDSVEMAELEIRKFFNNSLFKQFLMFE